MPESKAREGNKRAELNQFLIGCTNRRALMNMMSLGFSLGTNEFIPSAIECYYNSIVFIVEVKTDKQIEA